MLFWRIVDNKLHPVEEVKRLGFEEDDGLRIPDEYLEKQEFTVMRTCCGIGDWGIISAIPRLLKEKYPNCKVYIPSPILMEKLFNGILTEKSTWNNPFKNANYIFENNPYVDGFKDYIVGEIFHDHYRVYNKEKKDIPLVKQMLKFWQFNETEYSNCLPELYFSDGEIKKGDKIIKEFAGEKEFGGLLITDRFESQNGRYDEDNNKMLLNTYLEKWKDIPFFYWTYKNPNQLPINFKKCLDMRNIPTRIQLYIRTKAKFNIGTHCGFLDCVSKDSKVFQIQRVFPLNHNVIESEHYINKDNYKDKLKYA